MKSLVPKGAFSKVGGVLGSALGPMGAQVGTEAGNVLAKIVGFGAYNLQKNSLHVKDKIVGNPMPSFANRGNGLRICHREFVTDVYGSEAFNNTGFDINPGNDALFPWLSKVAHYFEEYMFHGLVFEYRPTSGAYNGTDTSLGSVMMATNYNVDDPDFRSKIEVDSYQYSTSCVPYQGMIHPVECAPGTNPLNRYYVRTAGSPDAKLFYDLGRFQTATKGMLADTIVGELWVTYDILLQKPRVNVRGPATGFLDATSTAACAAADPLNTMVVTTDSTSPDIVEFDSTTKILIPFVGTYLFTFCWDGAGIGAGATLTPGSNLVNTNPVHSNHPFTANEADFVCTFNCTHEVDRVTPANNQLTVGGMAGFNAGTCRLMVVHLPTLAMSRREGTTIARAVSAVRRSFRQNPPEIEDDVEERFEYVKSVPARVIRK